MSGSAVTKKLTLNITCRALGVLRCPIGHYLCPQKEGLSHLIAHEAWGCRCCDSHFHCSCFWMRPLLFIGNSQGVCGVRQVCECLWVYAWLLRNEGLSHLSVWFWESLFLDFFDHRPRCFLPSVSDGAFHGWQTFLIFSIF